jgi:dTDP-glucose pyrophosphorylase
MDRLDKKLLIVMKGDRFHSLVSVGDIQRALIKGLPLDTPVEQVLRSSIKVGHVGDSTETMKQRMISLRIEFFPILDDDGELVDTVFWEDVFESQSQPPIKMFNIPVVIMAGGLGSRLYPITKIIPKPLIPVGDTPIAEAIINRFHSYGCDRFIMSVNYKAELIKSHFASIENRPYDVEYVYENEPMGTAGSLSLIDQPPETPFFVSNCDILIENDLYEIYRFHQENRNELTVVAALRTFDIPYGTVESNSEGLLTAIREKPQLNYFVNSGMYVLEPSVVGEIPKGKFTHITEVMQSIMDRGGRVGVFPVTENSWMDIGEWKEYQKTQSRFEKPEDASRNAFPYT